MGQFYLGGYLEVLNQEKEKFMDKEEAFLKFFSKCFGFETDLSIEIQNLIVSIQNLHYLFYLLSRQNMDYESTWRVIIRFLTAFWIRGNYQHEFIDSGDDSTVCHFVIFCHFI